MNLDIIILWSEVSQRQKSNDIVYMGFPCSSVGKKNLPAVQETWVGPWVGKIPWRRAWQPTPVFLPGESPCTEEPGGLQSMEL